MTTRIAMLLDETGSMRPHVETTLSALNEYLTPLKSDGQEYIFSLVTFSAIRTLTLYSSVPIAGVDMDHIRTSYKPAGSTPLIDAAMKLILATEKVAAKGDKVIIVIQTDGEENCSAEFKLADLNAKIKAKTAEGWQFVFLGADIDAYKAAAQFGINAGQTMSYATAPEQTLDAFKALRANTQSYAAGQSINMDFTEQQRAEAGDKFAASPGGHPHQPSDPKPDPGPSPKPGNAPTLIDDIKI